MHVASFLFSHSKVDKSSSSIYRIPLYKVDQIIFQLFLLKKAKVETKKIRPANNPQSGIKAILQMGKSRQRDTKGLVLAGL